jgi:hypothetical protein
MIARLTCIGLFLILPPVSAQDKVPKYPVETDTLVVKLTSHEGSVAGASIRLYACRCEEDRGSHYGWPHQNTDVPRLDISSKGCLWI